MENQSPASIEKGPTRIPLYLDPELREEVQTSIHQVEQYYDLVDSKESADLSLLKKGSRMFVMTSKGEVCDLPLYRQNIFQILNTHHLGFRSPEVAPQIFQFTKNAQNLTKKIFHQRDDELTSETNVNWDIIFKTIQSIGQQSSSLRILSEKSLELPFLKNFHSSLVILHIKGQSKAEIIGTLWKSEKFYQLFDTKNFNILFNSIKKSKLKSFHTDSFIELDLPFNGSFLAKDFVSKKYSLIYLTTRHDFLNFHKEEIDLFQSATDLLGPHFERIIDQEFNSMRISELRICLKDFPLPLRLKSNFTINEFSNDIYEKSLEDRDIFFSKKVEQNFSLDLYDCDELRHYAFDLFHFQRISLLGELLNTLRHELSNPLFGLKLGSQVFATFDLSEDNKEMIFEIEKNIDRCQLIIENFSNLYQEHEELKSYPLKKFIDESLTLAKSEMREVRKDIQYHNGTETIEIKQPLIFIVQIIFNLIVNAAQAMRDQEQRPEIILCSDRSDENIIIDMYDNGPGIRPDKLQYLFKPFYTTKSYGTGLGLVLSRNLAIKMGGNLEYLSDREKGAHFRLTLPIQGNP